MVNTPKNILQETFCQSLICILIESIELKIGIDNHILVFVDYIEDHTNIHSDIFFIQILTKKYPFAGQLLQVHLLLSANQSSIKYCAKTKP